MLFYIFIEISNIIHLKVVLFLYILGCWGGGGKYSSLSLVTFSSYSTDPRNTTQEENVALYLPVRGTWKWNLANLNNEPDIEDLRVRTQLSDS
jgi:hypothetical protein